MENGGKLQDCAQGLGIRTTHGIHLHSSSAPKGVQCSGVVYSRTTQYTGRFVHCQNN
jgi:hypothetical protein